MSYSVQNIRNVCLLGHGGNGKTTLAESLLFYTGGSDRLGSVTDGNTVSDYDPEEIKRKISISTSILPIEYNGCKINLLDNPGYFDFHGEVIQSLRVADAGILVCACKGGMSVGTERGFKYLERRKLPCIIYISKTDEENGDFNAAFEALREKFGKTIAPLVVPIWDDKKVVTGYIDVLNKRAYTVQQGKVVEIDLPADKQDVVAEQYEALKESVAETSEEFLDKFIAGEDFTYAEMIQGLKAGVRDRSIIPVFCGCALSGLGNKALLDAIVSLLPDPTEGNGETGVNASGEKENFVIASGAAPAAFVFKTISDQYGKYSCVKVLSGSLKPDLSLINARTGETVRLGRLYIMKGKKATEVKELGCGDIGAIGKMDSLQTGDTLCDSHKVLAMDPMPFPEPCYSVAIAAKEKGQDDKVSGGLSRLAEEDRTFTVTNNAETHQMILSGTGDIQVDVIVARLKNRFGVDVVLSEPRVPYREKIRKKVKKQGRYKKQSGGHGQYGDVWIEFEPCDSEEMVFEEAVFGGAVPKNYFPAVEKGLRDACEHGVLAGYPVVNLKCTLVDGSYHPVDSSEMAFRTAAQLAFKAALPEANPVLLEPVVSLKVTIPDQYMGDIISDLNKRRGRILGMTPDDDGNQVVDAEVPLSEVGRYAIDLRSMTQSRGSFIQRPLRYEECPPAVQEKAIEAAAALNVEA